MSLTNGGAGGVGMRKSMLPIRCVTTYSKAKPTKKEVRATSAVTELIRVCRICLFTALVSPNS